VPVGCRHTSLVFPQPGLSYRGWHDYRNRRQGRCDGFPKDFSGKVGWIVAPFGRFSKDEGCRGVEWLVGFDRFDANGDWGFGGGWRQFAVPERWDLRHWVGGGFSAGSLVRMVWWTWWLGRRFGGRSSDFDRPDDLRPQPIHGKVSCGGRSAGRRSSDFDRPDDLRPRPIE
jgi:hypothetical protein